MSFLSDIAGAVVTSITGIDQSELQSQLTTAEQTITTVVEVVVVLLVIMTVELAFIVRNTSE